MQFIHDSVALHQACASMEGGEKLAYWQRISPFSIFRLLLFKFNQKVDCIVIVNFINMLS